jgi:hypothetical protein
MWYTIARQLRTNGKRPPPARQGVGFFVAGKKGVKRQANSGERGSNEDENGV